MMMSFSKLPHIHGAKDFHGLGFLLDLFPGPSYSIIIGFLATFQLKPLIGKLTFLRTTITASSN